MSSDSMENSIGSSQMFPRTPNISEHHRVLNLSAAAHERHLSTFKAHRVLIRDLDENVDELKGDLSEVSDLKTELAETKIAVGQLQQSLASHGAIVGDLVVRLQDREGKLDVKKTIISGIFALLIAITAAFGGYWAHPSGGPSYTPPTHQQALEIDRKIKESLPNNTQTFGQ